MSYLAVRNWDRYQHYKNRQPVWIKLHLALLDDEDMRIRVSPTTRLLWPYFLLLAGRYGNAIRNDPEAIGNATGMKTEAEREAIREAILELVKGGWLRTKQTPRRASKRASKPASSLLASHALAREEKKVLKNLPISSTSREDRRPTYVWQDSDEYELDPETLALIPTVQTRNP